MMMLIYTKGLEGCENDENSGPAMVKGKWKVDKELIGEAFGSMIFLDDVINVLGIEVRMD